MSIFFENILKTFIFISIVFGILMMCSGASEFKITTIMPGQDTLRVKRGVVGKGIKGKPNGEIGDNNLIVEDGVTIGTLEKPERSCVEVSGTGSNGSIGISINNENARKEYVIEVNNLGELTISDYSGVMTGMAGNEIIKISTTGKVGINVPCPQRDLDVMGVSKANIVYMNPVDPNSAEIAAEPKNDGMLICDSSDNNNIKRWDSTLNNWVAFGGGSCVFGPWEQKNNNTKYQAASDGIVLALKLFQDGQWGTMRILVDDSSSIPENITTRKSAVCNHIVGWKSAVAPVRKGQYWIVKNGRQIWWIPIN